MTKRFIGIDLAITANHQASVMENGSFLGKPFRFDNTFDGFNFLLEKTAPKNNPDCQLTFIMEPTSQVWIPLCCFLVSKGYKVFLVNPQKVAALRKFYNKYTKSDRIDSRVLAKLPLVDPENLNELYLPNHIIGSLKNYCKQRVKIVGSISARKNRIQAIFSSLIPKLMNTFNENKFTKGTRAFMRNYANPFKVKKLGITRLADFLDTNWFGQPEPEIAQEIFSASLDAVSIYQPMKESNSLPFDFEQRQDEINIELDLMEFEEEKVKMLDEKISNLYNQVDPQGILKSPMGMGNVNASIVLSVTGNMERFSNVRKYQCFVGLIPKKKQSSNHDKQGLSIRKNSCDLLKRTHYLVAETARRWDVEYAATYDSLIKKGLHHNQAMCALARKAAARNYALMKRLQQSCSLPDSKDDLSYKLKDLNGNIIDVKQARNIILEKFPSKRKLEKEKEKAVLHFKNRGSLETPHKCKDICFLQTESLL